MKSIKHLVLTFALFVSIAGYSQCVYEMTSESLTDIKFETQCIQNYIDSYESHISTQILGSRIVENDNGTFLLVKYRIDHKKNWVCIIQLSFVNSTARFAENGELNSCESEELSLEVFKFEKGEIIGCEKANHKISTKL